MKVSIYLRDLDKWTQIPSTFLCKIDTVFCGDYGCPKVLPEVEKLIEFKNELSMKGIQLHYISPKVSQAMIWAEAQRVLKIMECGISVSINDWGLLYRLKPNIKSEYEIYLGRLLTKSIADWTWSDIFLGKESKDAAEYLSQNSFYEDKKMKYFKDWGIKGIEVNIHNQGEESCIAIQKQGFSIIGYADRVISAVSRSCPILRLEGMNDPTIDCRHLCIEEYSLDPSNEKANKVYPTMELHGNVIYTKNDQKMTWTGYDRLVYTWSNELIHKLS